VESAVSKDVDTTYWRGAPSHDKLVILFALGLGQALCGPWHRAREEER